MGKENTEKTILVIILLYIFFSIRGNRIWEDGFNKGFHNIADKEY